MSHPAPSVVSDVIGDGLAVFDLERRKLHVLNETAGLAWQLLEDGRAATLVDDLAGTYGVSPDRIRDDVEAILDEFRRDGLLAGSDVVEATVDAPADAVPAPTPDGRHQLGPYRLIDTVVGIATDDEVAADAIAAVLEPLLADDEDVDRWLTVTDGPHAGRRHAVLQVLADVNAAAVASCPDHLVVHAGAVADDGGVALLPAPPDHGKSTLTTALVRSGLRYLTDEAAAVGADLQCRPFPKAIALDPGSFPLFDWFEPDPAVEAVLDGSARYLLPTTVGSIGVTAPVRVIVAPDWQAGAPTNLERLDPVDALHRLLRDTFDFAAGGQPVFSILARLVETVPVYRLTYDQLDEGVAAVRRALAES